MAIDVFFFLLALIVLAGAIVAVSMRNLIHCALGLTAALAGLAGFYLQLHAQFIGFAQVLVYAGAVAILIVFAILLTRGSEPAGRPAFSSLWAAGVAIAAAVFGLLAWIILSSKALPPPSNAVPDTNVSHIGDALMTRYVLPLEAIGLLLTTALIGAVIIALREKGER